VSSLNGFGSRIDLLANNLERAVPNLIRKVALAADQAVVSQTPVDTGRARSNWIVQIGSAYTGTIGPRSPGSRGSTGADNIQGSLSQAQAEIATYTQGEIHITNNLPYIERLNNGWSAQAPSGYVEAAVLAAVNAVTANPLLD
jgi:hypothetical protein